MSVAGFALSPGALGRVGRDLQRPENVLAFRDGTVFASSDRGHVVRIDPDGTQTRIGDIPGAAPTTMALESDEALIVNDTADGNVHRLRFDGRYETVLDTLDGEPLGSANYVFRDNRDRIWVAVATRRRPPHDPIHVVPDGCIALIDGEDVRVVADGLRWPNEVRLDAQERYAYVSETFGQRILRFPVEPDGSLGEPEVVGPDPLGDVALPDGIALDAAGNVWVAVVSRNGLMVIEPDGRAHTVFEQPVPEALAALGAALASGTIPREALAACAGPDLRLLTSVGFAGPELRTVVMGSLAMSSLVSFEAPVGGLPLRHQHTAAAAPRAPSAAP